MSRPLLLDLFCGAGGAAMGYHRAGFDVVGVDIKPQPNYPFEFTQSDALTSFTAGFHAIHASPPCQNFSTASGVAKKSGKKYQDLISATREFCDQSGLLYVIENVPKAPLIDPVSLCGSSFGLDVRRHRNFETNWDLVGLPCDHGWQTPRFRSLASKQVKAGRLASVVGVHGNCNYAGEREIREKAMGIDWMGSYELTQAIPPAYTEFIGRQLIAHLST